MSRKLITMLSLVVLVGVLSGVGYANAIQITLGQSTTGTAWAGNTGASFSNEVSGYAYQGVNAGTFWIQDSTITGTGCDWACNLNSNSEIVTVTIGADTLVGTLSLHQEAFGEYLKGSFLITSATAGFANTGYAVGENVGADLSVVGGAVSAGQIQTDAVPEPGTIAMVGSGLLAMAGALRRKI